MKKKGPAMRNIPAKIVINLAGNERLSQTVAELFEKTGMKNANEIAALALTQLNAALPSSPVKLTVNVNENNKKPIQ
jgi:hypothetical protein